MLQCCGRGAFITVIFEWMVEEAFVKEPISEHYKGSQQKLATLHEFSSSVAQSDSAVLLSLDFFHCLICICFYGPVDLEGTVSQKL